MISRVWVFFILGWRRIPRHIGKWRTNTIADRVVALISRRPPALGEPCELASGSFLIRNSFNVFQSREFMAPSCMREIMTIPYLKPSMVLLLTIRWLMGGGGGHWASTWKWLSSAPVFVHTPYATDIPCTLLRFGGVRIGGRNGGTPYVDYRNGATWGNRAM